MLVALTSFDLRIPGCSSLKEKRHVVKSVIAGLRGKFNVSVAEVDHHELWQRTTIAVGAVGGQGYHLKKVVHEVTRYLEVQPGVDIIDAVTTLHSQDD